MPIAVPTTSSPPDTRTVRVAIIGGGPAGLGAAISFKQVVEASPDVRFEVTIYEQARELREIGAGLSLHENAWRVLKLLGAADDTTGFDKKHTQHLNGLTGEVISVYPPSTLPVDLQPTRVLRTRLQAALVKQVPEGTIQLSKRLVKLRDLGPQAGVELDFEDGTTVEADVVVGAEGIRSVVRKAAFPEHEIKFTGTTIWRVLLPNAALDTVPGLETRTSWFHHPLGTGHFYVSGVSTPEEEARGEGQWEIAARAVEDPTKVTREKVSWGVPATNAHVESHFTDYAEPVRQGLKLVPEGAWREFSAFAGPHLETLHAWDGKLVLLGDASHPLTGAFGSGAAFALEDGYILARALSYAFAHSSAKEPPILAGAQLFDAIRSPYYRRMYAHLAAQKQAAPGPDVPAEERLRRRVAGFGEVGKGADTMAWIYGNDIARVWDDAVEKLAAAAA